MYHYTAIIESEYITIIRHADGQRLHSLIGSDRYSDRYDDIPYHTDLTIIINMLVSAGWVPADVSRLQVLEQVLPVYVTH